MYQIAHKDKFGFYLFFLFLEDAHIDKRRLYKKGGIRNIITISGNQYLFHKIYFNSKRITLYIKVQLLSSKEVTQRSGSSLRNVVFFLHTSTTCKVPTNHQQY